MSTTLHVYTIISNPIFSGGIENLIQTKIVPETKIIRTESLEALINREKLPGQNDAELLIYDVVKFTNKDFNYLLNLITSDPDFKILIITANINISDVKLLFEIGVMGVVNNNILPEQFISFVRKILKGNKVLSPEYWDLIIEYFFHSVENNDLTKEKKNNTKEDVILYSELTAREKEILGYICDGKNTREISEELYISLHTVETHRRKILTKLGVKNTASMVKVAIKSNLVAI